MPRAEVAQHRLVVLTGQEASSPIIAHALDALGWGTAETLIVEDLVRGTDLSRFPLNRNLWPHYAVWCAAAGYDAVLVTLFRGLAYYLMQTRPESTWVLPYRSTLGDKSLGIVLDEQGLVSTELEEHIIKDWRERFLFFHAGALDRLDHRISSEGFARTFPAENDPARFLADAFFIFMPHPETETALCADTLGIRISADDYLAWTAGQGIPSILKNIPDNRHLVLVDEGYDILDLMTGALDRGEVVRGLVMYDQRRPVVRDPERLIPGIRSERWISELRQATAVGRYIGYGDPANYTVDVSPNPGAVALSVVIVYHNRQAYFATLIAAFRAQTEQGFELVVVDNGSDKDIQTQEILDAGHLPFGLRIIRNMNAYPGSARNTGARAAVGEFVVFFDDDNLPKPEFVQTFLEAGRRGTYDVTLCFRDLFVPREGTEIIQKGILLSAPHVKYANALRNYMGDGVFIIRRDLFLQLYYTEFFEVGREDVEFLQYVCAAGYRVGILPRAPYLYQISNTDKIGHSHLTHRTGAAENLDYGTYCKYYRSAGSFSGRKFRQMADTAMVHKPFLQWRWLRARLARIPLLRTVYYRFFR
ncbi:MAG: glycosyltransferase family 2 protein [Rhodobacteraceae bacterium]|nr:glycosyltransferase family 2 protein [Paracoccaceae bacterium]